MISVRTIDDLDGSAIEIDLNGRVVRLALIDGQPAAWWAAADDPNGPPPTCGPWCRLVEPGDPKDAQDHDDNDGFDGRPRTPAEVAADMAASIKQFLS